ncbi:MAG: glycosyltransferase family 39 protein, partial [Chloroflexota bacterium]
MKVMTASRLDKLPATLEAKPIYQYMLLAAIVLLASALRFFRLGQWSFWIDEIFTVNRAQAHVLEATSIQFWEHPPSLYLIAGALQIMGVGELSARLVPALIGIASLVVLYFPIRRVFGSIVALLAILLLVVSPWHLYWSQNARFYTAVLLFYTLAMFAFLIGFERDRPWYLVAFWVFLLLAFRERVFAAFFVPVMLSYLFLLWLLPFEKPAGYRLRNLLIVLLPPIVYAFYELFRLVTGGNPPLVDTYRTFTSSPYGPIDDPFRIGMFVVLSVGIPLAVLSI